MDIIDGGLTHPDALIVLIRAYHEKNNLIDKITHIENRKGNWTIKANKTITVYEVLYIISEFNKVLSYDGISEFWINNNRFEDVGGTTLSPKNLANLINNL